MAEYSFTTLWKFNSPIEDVWDEIYSPETWPEWWVYVLETQELRKGDELGIGSLWKYRWKTRLFYSFSFVVETTVVEPPLRLKGIASGDLEGTGTWQLESDGKNTKVSYEWNVNTTKSWMNYLAPVAYPLFKWNHNAVMEEGYRGLTKKLERRNNNL